MVVNNSDLPGGSDSKESAWSVGELGLIPGLEDFPGEGNGNHLQYSRPENFMERGVLLDTVLGVSKSWAWLSKYKWNRIEQPVEGTKYNWHYPKHTKSRDFHYLMFLWQFLGVLFDMIFRAWFIRIDDPESHYKKIKTSMEIICTWKCIRQQYQLGQIKGDQKSEKKMVCNEISVEWFWKSFGIYLGI